MMTRLCWFATLLFSITCKASDPKFKLHVEIN